jgi:hypothetical protein
MWQEGYGGFATGNGGAITIYGATIAGTQNTVEGQNK